ncbi:unnamed protein product [Trichobilharzia regenti]|nr:unnamed protein product [Trichobilharzia regenti]
MEDCLNGTVTSAHFQRDAEETTANLPSLPGKTGFYTMAGILDFLQLEWSKMQLERTQWDVEKAELQIQRYLVDSSSFSVSPGFGNSTVCNLSDSSSLFGGSLEQEEHPMNVSPKHGR